MRPDDTPPIVWDGTPARAQAIEGYARNSALLVRWQWRPGVDETARVLEEPEEGDLTRSSEWVVVPIGATVYRLEARNPDSPLRVRTPRTAAAPFVD